MSEVIKIRVTKCSKETYWYSTEIGMEYEVVDNNQGFYYCNYIQGFFDKSDCEVISDPSAPEKLKTEKVFSEKELEILEEAKYNCYLNLKSFPKDKLSVAEKVFMMDYEKQFSEKPDDLKELSIELRKKHISEGTVPELKKKQEPPANWYVENDGSEDLRFAVEILGLDKRYERAGFGFFIRDTGFTMWGREVYHRDDIYKLTKEQVIKMAESKKLKDTITSRDFVNGEKPLGGYHPLMVPRPRAENFVKYDETRPIFPNMQVTDLGRSWSVISYLRKKHTNGKWYYQCFSRGETRGQENIPEGAKLMMIGQLVQDVYFSLLVGIVDLNFIPPGLSLPLFELCPEDMQMSEEERLCLNATSREQPKNVLLFKELAEYVHKNSKSAKIFFYDTSNIEMEVIGEIKPKFSIGINGNTEGFNLENIAVVNQIKPLVNFILGNYLRLSEEYERCNQLKPNNMSDEKGTDVPVVDPASTRELSFGEKAAGVNFNPGGHPEVNLIKEKVAELIDHCHEARKYATGEKARYYSKAISQFEDAQMNAVKAATWSH